MTTVDAMAPCIVNTSAVMILTLQDNWVHVFSKREFLTHMLILMPRKCRYVNVQSKCSELLNTYRADHFIDDIFKCIFLNEKNLHFFLKSENMTGHYLNQRWLSHHYADAIFKWIYCNELFCILIHIPLKFVPEGLIDNKSSIVQVVARHQKSTKPVP